MSARCSCYAIHFYNGEFYWEFGTFNAKYGKSAPPYKYIDTNWFLVHLSKFQILCTQTLWVKSQTYFAHRISILSTENNCLNCSRHFIRWNVSVLCISFLFLYLINEMSVMCVSLFNGFTSRHDPLTMMATTTMMKSSWICWNIWFGELNKAQS